MSDHSKSDRTNRTFVYQPRTIEQLRKRRDALPWWRAELIEAERKENQLFADIRAAKAAKRGGNAG